MVGIFPKHTMKRKGMDNSIEKFSKWDKKFQEFLYLFGISEKKNKEK